MLISPLYCIVRLQCSLKTVLYWLPSLKFRLTTSKIIKKNYAPLRLLDDEEIKRWRQKWDALDKFLSHFSEYCLVFMPTKKLPYDSTLTLTIGPKVDLTL